MKNLIHVAVLNLCDFGLTLSGTQMNKILYYLFCFSGHVDLTTKTCSLSFGRHMVVPYGISHLSVNRTVGCLDQFREMSFRTVLVSLE